MNIFLKITLFQVYRELFLAIMVNSKASTTTNTQLLDPEVKLAHDNYQYRRFVIPLLFVMAIKTAMMAVTILVVSY